MRKFFTLMLTICAIQGMAQIGARFNYGYCYFSSYETKQGFRDNFQAGLIYEHKLKPKISLQPELLFCQNWIYTYDNPNYQNPKDIKLNYIKAYIHAKIQSNTKLNIYFMPGIYDGILVYKYDDFNKFNYRKTDFGLSFYLGASLKIGKIQPFVDFTYQKGLIAVHGSSYNNWNSINCGATYKF